MKELHLADRLILRMALNRERVFLEYLERFVSDPAGLQLYRMRMKRIDALLADLGDGSRIVVFPAPIEI